MTSNPREHLNKLLDPKFYLENFTKIKGKTPGLIPFVLNDAQKDLFNSLRVNPRVMILKARQIGFCVSPHTKVLLSNLKWVEIDDVHPGDRVVSVDEFCSGGRGNGRKMRTAVVEKKSEIVAPAFKITFDDGRQLIATATHKFLSRLRGGSFVGWRKVEATRPGDIIRYITKPWGESTPEDYWFGGILDGEGCLRYKNHTGAEVCATQRLGLLFDSIKSYAAASGLNYKLEHDDRPSVEGGKFGNKPCAKVVFNRMDEVFQILGKTRPVRFIGQEWWNGKGLPGSRSGIGWAKVVSVELMGEQRMIDLQTSGHTYIAEGFVSHNSTAVTGFLYHKTITNPGTNTALIGYNSDLTAELLDKVKTIYRTTPKSIQPTIQYNSKYEISFPAIDSKILVLPSSENVGRGYTLHNVLCTELAFWDKAEEKMLAIENAVPQNGSIVIESTPNAIGNLYHRMWMADNGYDKKKYGWWWHYTEAEIEIIRKRINNPMRFAQEYELEFLSTGRPVFPTDLVKKCRKNILHVGDKVRDENKTEYTVTKDEDGFIMYFPPRPGRIYAVGADVAEGVTGGDLSVAVVWDRATGEEVGFWRGYLPPDRFGMKLNKWGRLYNNALMVVEINNHGLTTVTALKNLLYPQMYFRQANYDSMRTSWSDRLGWRTTKITRPLMIDDFRDALQEGSITIHSESTLDEMLTFVFDDGGNMVAQNSFHDDCIFACAIGFQGFKVLYGSKLEQISYEDYLPTSTPY